MIEKTVSEIHFTDAQVFPVHEFLKMIADEFLHLRMSHVRLGIPRFRSLDVLILSFSLQAEAA